MADVIFYSTGEIFWVSDPPPRKLHIGIPDVFPAVPPDHLFTYSMAAHTLERAGHNVVGAYGRQRKMVRDAFSQGSKFHGDPEILALGHLFRPERTVLVLIATEDGNRSESGDDEFRRIPFTLREREALQTFRSRGGGLYITWDHGRLGHISLQELGLEGPVESAPEESYRPTVAWSNDSTGEAKVETQGVIIRKDGSKEPVTVMVSKGAPAGYLQKIVPATLLHRDDNDEPAPQPPHPIFNGVGGSDGIWIPAHMHEGKLKVDVTLQKISEQRLPPGVKTLAVHVPLIETTFVSFAVMAYKDPLWALEDGRLSIKEGAVVWDTSFHHLIDINWSSNGCVPWDPFVPFSAQALWKEQFPPELFEARLERGMKRLFVNAIKWLANEFPRNPTCALHAPQLGATASGR